MESVPLVLLGSLHFTLAKQVVTANTLGGLEFVYLSTKPGTTRHLKLFKYGLEIGQVFGFFQRD